MISGQPPTRKVFEIFHKNSVAVRGLITLKVFSKLTAVRSLKVNIPFKVFYYSLCGIVGSNSLRGYTILCGIEQWVVDLWSNTFQMF